MRPLLTRRVAQRTRVALRPRFNRQIIRCVYFYSRMRNWYDVAFCVQPTCRKFSRRNTAAISRKSREGHFVSSQNPWSPTAAGTNERSNWLIRLWLTPITRLTETDLAPDLPVSPPPSSPRWSPRTNARTTSAGHTTRSSSRSRVRFPRRSNRCPPAATANQSRTT